MALTRVSAKTGLANLALATIGESPISDINSSDPAAVNARAVIDQVILEEQADFSWPELKMTVKLQADNTFVPTAADAFGYRFALPDDYVRPAKDVNELVVTDTLGGKVRYFIKSGFVYAAASEIHLNYIRESDDPSEWSPWLTRCVYHSLAILLAPARNKSATLVDRLIQVFEQIVRKRTRHQASKNTVSERRRRGGSSYDAAGRGYF